MHRYESECHAKSSPHVILFGWRGSKHQLTNKLTNHAKRLICYFQGQDHCKSSYDQNISISTVSFELLILLLPNLVWWHIIINQSVLQRNWIVVLKVKVTAKFQLQILLQLTLVCWYITIRWIVLWKDWISLLWSLSRSQKRFRTPVNVHLDDSSSAAESSVTKLGMVMQYHGPKCHARRLVCCLQVQGHSKGSFDQIRLFLPYLLNCWSFVRSSLIIWYIIIRWSVLCTN